MCAECEVKKETWPLRLFDKEKHDNHVLCTDSRFR